MQNLDIILPSMQGTLRRQSKKKLFCRIPRALSSIGQIYGRRSSSGFCHVDSSRARNDHCDDILVHLEKTFNL